MKTDALFTSNWLKADDIDALADENTETAVLVIDRVEMADVGQAGDQKPVIYFKGQKLPFILNKTNATTIAGIYGRETDDWAGKPVGLFTTEVEYQGKMSLGIRVRLKAPKAGKTKAESIEGKEMPF